MRVCVRERKRKRMKERRNICAFCEEKEQRKRKGHACENDGLNSGGRGSVQGHCGESICSCA